MKNKRSLSPKEAASALGISIRTLYRWEAAAKHGYEVVAVIVEHASSLNEHRRGMKQLLALVGAQATDVVLLEYPDRLVRFGFSYLEQAFGWMGVRLEVLDPPKQWQPTEEVVQDVLTIVTVCAGRLYGNTLARSMRSRVQTALKECEERAQATNGEPHGTG
jgi:putative resolvase